MEYNPYYAPPPGIPAPAHQYLPPQPPADPYYHHYAHHHAPPPPAAAMTATGGLSGEIHTLFISGLPDDIKAREIHNLFRRRHGFQHCLLEYTGRGDQAVAFATFTNHQLAVAAMSELNGVIFDPDTGDTLHVELARSNSRRRPTGDGAYDIIDRREKVKSDDQDKWSDDGSGGSDEPSGTENDNSSKRASAESGGRKRKAHGSQSARNGHSEKPSTDNISPCSTLFIANLSDTCTEEELEKLFSDCHGFQVLKLQKKRGKPVAFADFLDVEASTEAKEKLLGSSQFAASDAGLHLEYARSKMRKT